MSWCALFTSSGLPIWSSSVERFSPPTTYQALAKGLVAAASDKRLHFASAGGDGAAMAHTELGSFNLVLVTTKAESHEDACTASKVLMNAVSLLLNLPSRSPSLAKLTREETAVLQVRNSSFLCYIHIIISFLPSPPLQRFPGLKLPLRSPMLFSRPWSRPFLSATRSTLQGLAVFDAVFPGSSTYLFSGNCLIGASNKYDSLMKCVTVN